MLIINEVIDLHEGVWIIQESRVVQVILSYLLISVKISMESY